MPAMVASPVRWRLLVALGVSVGACKSDPPVQKDPPRTQADPAPAPTPPKPAPPAAEVEPGRRIGPLSLGAKPPEGHDGARTSADGALRLYWSERGVQATVGKDGVVIAAGGLSPAADPFFRKAFEGKTAEGIGVGATAAQVEARLGPCQESPASSAFVSARVVLTCKPAGLTLDLSKPGGEVIAMWVGATAP